MTMDLCGLKKTYIYLLKFLWSGRGLAAEWFSCWSHPGSLQSVGISAGPVGFTHRPQVSSLLVRTPWSSPMWPLCQLDWTFSCHGGSKFSLCYISYFHWPKQVTHSWLDSRGREIDYFLMEIAPVSLCKECGYRDRKILLPSLHSTTPLPSKSS